MAGNDTPAQNPAVFSKDQVAALQALISTNISDAIAKYASRQEAATPKPPSGDSGESPEITVFEPTSAPRQPIPAGSRQKGSRTGDKKSIQTGSDSGDTESISSASDIKNLTERQRDALAGDKEAEAFT